MHTCTVLPLFLQHQSIVNLLLQISKHIHGTVRYSLVLTGGNPLSYRLGHCTLGELTLYFREGATMVLL